MQNAAASDGDKRRAFDAAIQKQTTIMLENITGYGIDNHLVALRDISKAMAEKEQRAPPKLFETYMYKEVCACRRVCKQFMVVVQVMRFPLSTSQVTTTLPNTFLCYGPVVDDGYGGAYNLRANEILFAISAFNACTWTSAVAMRRSLIDCLHDTRRLLLNTAPT
jgi:hypothetical protein